jgi:YD repeat-containing protein
MSLVITADCGHVILIGLTKVSREVVRSTGQISGPVPAVSSTPAGNSSGTGTAVTRFEDLLKPSVKDINVVSEYTNGRLTKTTIGQDSVTEFVYNASGQVIITRQKSLSTQETRQSINFYDVSHRLIGTVDPEGSIVEFRYDHAGRKVQTIQYANTNTQVQADSKLSDLIQPDNAKDIRSFSYYDKDDRLVASINGEGFLTEYVYDNLNLLRKTIAYQKALSSGDYAENSTLDQLRALAGSALTISEKEYDVLNRLKSEKPVMAVSRDWNTIRAEMLSPASMQPEHWTAVN